MHIESALAIQFQYFLAARTAVAAVVTAATYVVTAGTVAATLAQLTVDDTEVKKVETPNI